jgi:putative (di)nucleoside polyphosphate hydrolase
MYRKGVSAFIINRKGEFLLVNLVSFEDKYFAIPGGGVKEGESLEDAVYREVQEELGIEKESLGYIGKSDTPVSFKFKVIKMTRDGKEYEGSERNFFGFLFIGNDNEINLQEDEVSSYKWVSFDNLDEHLLFDNQLEETLGKVIEIFPEIIQK